MSAHQGSEQPLFSAKCLRTGPGGRYLAAGASSRLAVFSDRLEIDDMAIYYPYLLDLQASPVLGDSWNVLEVVYAAADGSRVERCFSFPSYITRKGARTFQEMWSQIMTARAQFAHGTAAAAGNSRSAEKVPGFPPPVRAVPRCSRLPEIGGRPAVAVHSARVAFPPCCPVCGAEADTVATLRMVSGFWRYLPAGAPVEWLVPACSAHRLLGKAIVVEHWEADSSEIRCSFSSALYAERFFDANSTGGVLPRRADPAPFTPGSKDTAPFTPVSKDDDSPLAREIKAGTRFVVYRYAISAVLWVFRISDAQPVRPGESLLLPGLRYSLLTATAGWWTLSGIALVLSTLFTNFSGGIDVTELVFTVARGDPLPPHRGEGYAKALNKWAPSRGALTAGAG